MIGLRRSALIVGILSLALSLFASGALAADASANNGKKNKVARISAGPTVVEWTPEVDHERLLLTVSTPWGEVWSKEFPAGKNPTFRLQDVPGRVIDGTYGWELRVVPKIHPQLQKEMERLREAGDDGALLRLRAEAGLDQETIESGGFMILQGTIVSPDLVEQDANDSPGVSAMAAPGGTRGFSMTGWSAGATDETRKAFDFVIPDDLIVQGSACVGLDCVNNEVFNFDTLRLKENNTRLQFDDTSSTTGFATTNWQIRANASASGGGSFLGIVDQGATGSSEGGTIVMAVEAGASANSLFVDNTSRVGFRTSNPVLDLHVVTGNTPGWRLEQNSSSGFTAQTWDVAANEANFFIRDVTRGSLLPFRIRPGAPTSSIDIAASGNVGIGTGSPSLHRLDVNLTGTSGMRAYVASGASTTGLELQPGVGGANRIVSYDRGLAQYVPIVIQAGLIGLAVNTNGYLGLGGIGTAGHPIQHMNGAYLSPAGVWTDASSRDYKDDVLDLDASEAMETLRGLAPVKFTYKAEPGEQHVGFIAEDVPDMVATADRKGLAPMDVVAVLTKVVQEQQRIIDELNQRLSELERKQ